MTRISKRRIDKLIEQRMYEIFWEHLASLNSSVLVKEFILNILSYNEQVIIAKRLAIAILLARGYTYAEIDQTLKVSMATVGSIHKQILIGAPGYVSAIKATQKRKSQEEFWDMIEEILLKLSAPAKIGTPTHDRKSEKGKKLYLRKLKREVF